jgi:L-aminopeptidase/D-esterase-like protein
VVRVPIVPAAVVFDLFPDPSARPGPDAGEAAYRSASDAPVVNGLIGVGTGTTVAKWRGFQHMRPGGVGSGARRGGDLIVGAMVAVNAVGDVFTLAGESLTGGEHEPGPPALFPVAEANTTLGVVATNARLTRNELSRLALRAHDAYAACIRPAHTRFDGDIVFAVSFGDVEADVEAVAEAAFGATASAVENAVRTSAS